MSERKWNASWIENIYCPENTAPVFYKTFYLEKDFEAAQIFISGVGFYLLKINGRRVGDELLAPAFTAYDKTVLYNTYSVNDYLKQGENEIEVILGNGWYNETVPNTWEFEHATWRARPQLICELVIDGQIAVKTDTSWLCGESNWTYNQLRCGETFDGTADTQKRCNATVSHGTGGILKLQKSPPVRLREIIEPVSRCADNSTVYDFGVNISGNIEVTIKGNKGDGVRIKYSERINPDGTLDREHIAQYIYDERFQEDEFILSQDGEESWHGEFSYHGFRYAQIETTAQLISVKARCFHTDLKPMGGFECDVDFLNELQSNILRSTLTNFHHIPTDCPHREKNGWTGDAVLSCEQALFNLDMKQAYIKWLDDIVDGQRPNGAISCIVPTSIWGYNWGTGTTWDIALFEIPWQMYCYSGEIDILKRYYPAMQKYYGFMLTMEENGIWRNGLGDWCPPKGTKTAPTEAMLTAAAYRIAEIFARCSVILGFDDNANSAQIKAAEIKKNFIYEFEDKTPDTQTLLATQLYFGLTTKPQELAERLIKQLELADYHTQSGIFGIKYIFNALTDNGCFDAAYRLACAEGYPSFKQLLENSGGTLSEHWEKDSSLNHHMFSSIGDWFYKGIAGIHYDEQNVGFKNIIIKPHIPHDCKYFKAWHNTPHGKFTVEFNVDKFIITLPEGSTADFIFGDIKQKISQSETIKI